MNDYLPELEQWLTSGELVGANSDSLYRWEPGFDADRQVVHIKIGSFFHRIFLRPDIFVKRFYHEVFALPIEDWRWQENIELFDGFCSLSVDIQLHFQATLKFAQRNAEHLSHINTFIKENYQQLIDDIVHQEVQALNDAHWVKQGLHDVERKIALSLCESLMVQNIQAQAVCRLAANFKEFSNIQPGKDRVYFAVLQQSHELIEQKNQALFEQQSALKEQKLYHRQQQLEYLKKLADIERQRREHEATQRRILLEDKENHLATEQEIERRIHIQTMAHQNKLAEIEAEAKLISQNKITLNEQNIETKNTSDQYAHLNELEAIKNKAELEKRQRQFDNQSKIHQAKVQAEIERYENQQQAWQSAKLKIHLQKTELQKQLKILDKELEEDLAQIEAEQSPAPLTLPFQKLVKSETQEERRRLSSKIRQEIELNILEQQRLELEKAIAAAREADK